MDQAMDFGSALKALKAGSRVGRSAWNRNGMHLALVRDWNGSINAEFREDYSLLPWIGMKTAQGDFVPWVASQADVLAEDWQFIPGTASSAMPAIAID